MDLLEDDVLVELYQLKGLQMPKDLAEYAGEYDTDSDMDEVLEWAKQPTGFVYGFFKGWRICDSYYENQLKRAW